MTITETVVLGGPLDGDLMRLAYGPDGTPLAKRVHFPIAATMNELTTRTHYHPPDQWVAVYRVAWTPCGYQLEYEGNEAVG